MIARKYVDSLSAFVNARSEWKRSDGKSYTEPFYNYDYEHELHKASPTAWNEMSEYMTRMDALLGTKPLPANMSQAILTIKEARNMIVEDLEASAERHVVKPPIPLARAWFPVADNSHEFRLFGPPCGKSELGVLLANRLGRPLALAIADCPLFVNNNRDNSGVFIAGGLAVALATGLTDFSDIDWFINARNEVDAEDVTQRWIGWCNVELAPLLRAKCLGTTCPGVLEIQHTHKTLTVTMKIPNEDGSTTETFSMQLVREYHRSIECTLVSFDLKCCQAAFNGNRLLVTPEFVQTMRRKIEVVDPTKDRDGRYARRLLKYMVRYNLCALIPGWDASLFDHVKVTAQHSSSRIRELCHLLPGGGIIFVILYKMYEIWGKSALVPVENNDYDFSDKPESIVIKSFPVPLVYGSDACPGRVRTSPWLDGVTIGYVIDMFQTAELIDRNFT